MEDKAQATLGVRLDAKEHNSVQHGHHDVTPACLHNRDVDRGWVAILVISDAGPADVHDLGELLRVPPAPDPTSRQGSLQPLPPAPAFQPG